MSKKFVARGTNTELDIDSLVCDDSTKKMYYFDSEGNVKVVKLRKVFEFDWKEDVDEDSLINPYINGVWVEDGYLLPDEEEEKEEPGEEGIKSLGKFLKSHVVEIPISGLKYCKIVVNEFENKIVASVTSNYNWEPGIAPQYLRKVYLGSIRDMMASCSSEEDVLEFIESIKEFD